MRKSGYLRSFGILSFTTLISRILGMVRDIMMAMMFGAGMVMDAFVLAFTIPNLFRALFGEGALSAAFIPVFTETLEKDGKEKATELSEAVVTILIIALSVISFISVMGCVLFSLFPGFSEKTYLVLGLSEILLPYLFFVCLVAFLTALLNSLGHFTLPALAPIIFNVCEIGGIIIFLKLSRSPITRIYGISAAILLSGLLQVLIQYPALSGKGFNLKLKIDFRNPALIKIIKMMAPVLISVTVIELNVFLDRIIAWLFIPTEGALTVLYMGNRLMQFPLALIGIAISNAVFPIFARYAAQKDENTLGKAVVESGAFTLFLSIPASIGLMALAKPIVSLIYQHHAFTQDAALRTSWVLAIYSAGIWVYSLSRILTKAFYSIGDTNTPMKLALRAVAINFVFNLLLVFPMEEKGLALATLISSIFNLVNLFLILKKRIPIPLSEVIFFLIKTAVASIIMGIAVWYLGLFSPEDGRLWYRFLAVSISVSGGMLIYTLLAVIFRIRVIKMLRG